MNHLHLRKVIFFAHLLIIILCSSSLAIAQNADSLRGVLIERKQDDTTRVNLYASTASAYRFTSPDSMISIADRGIALAEKLNFDKGKAKCLLAKTVACLISGNLEEGKRLSLDAIAIYGKTNDSIAMGAAFFYLAAIFYNEAKYEQAIQYYIKTARAYRNADNYDRLGDVLDNIGVCYSTIGNFSEALKYYLEGLKVREKADDKEGIATSMGNIGRVYASLGNNKKAVAYINKSIATQAGATPDGRMINYENAGNVYLSINDTLNALRAFENAIHVADSAKLLGTMNRILVNAAEVHITMGNYDKAYLLYRQCLANTKFPNIPAVDAMINRGLGRIYVHNKNYKEGVTKLEKAVAMFKENEMKDHLTETMKELSIGYGELHDYEKAFKTMRLYNSYRDSLLNEETDKKVQGLQYDYDLQKKQSAIEILEKNRAIAESNAGKQRAVSLGLVSGLALLFIIIGLMYRNGQRQKEARTLIMQQATSLGELNNYKDKIFSVLAHDLRSPIAALTASVNMLDENIITPGEFSELKPMIHKQLTSVTLLLDNLLKWSMNHMTGGKATKKETLNLHQLVAQNLTLLHDIFEEKTITIHNNVPIGITAIGDRNDIDIIIRNLISNALKFTNPGGTISIAAVTGQDRIELSIADNGVGMSEAQMKKLFTVSADNSSPGTMGESGMGLGLLMSYEFARANNGDITVTSESGKGSTFTLVLQG